MIWSILYTYTTRTKTLTTLTWLSRVCPCGLASLWRESNTRSVSALYLCYYRRYYGTTTTLPKAKPESPLSLFRILHRRGCGSCCPPSSARESQSSISPRCTLPWPYTYTSMCKHSYWVQALTLHWVQALTCTTSYSQYVQCNCLHSMKCKCKHLHVHLHSIK